jgi:transposase
MELSGVCWRHPQQEVRMKKRNIQKRNLLGQSLTSEEIETLEQLAKHHHYPDFRRRALGLLALNAGRSVVDICEFLHVSDQPIYNWAKGWREKGIAGILSGHKGGPPVKLTQEMLDVAAEIACQEPLTLAKIAVRIAERFPDAPSFSLDRLAVGLKARGLSFKRNRLSLKKNEMKPGFSR